MRLLLVVCLAAALASAAEPISAERLRAHVRFLSHDLLEGRSPGSRGGQLTTEYLAAQFALAGAEPAAPDGSFFQRVPLVGVQTSPAAKLVALAGDPLTFDWIRDFVGATGLQEPDAAFAADTIFAGHGITAPEYGWDDYGDVDVSGKVVILFTNEPPSESADFFDAEGLTYYGRWTYKFEEALRRGAVAAILIHTRETAGYGWDVVRNSWGREAIQMPRPDGQPALAFAGWVTRDAGERLLAAAGHSVDELLEQANTKGFRAMPLGFRIEGEAPAKVRQIETRNVTAVIPGQDPARRSEAVVFNAHWDHLGVGGDNPEDQIFNGAVDNATGCALLLEMARAWASLEQKPARSALFLAVTAEESGLLGAEHFAANPLIPAGQIAAALNFDSYAPLGVPGSISAVGAERTTLLPLVEDAARRFGLTVKPARRTGSGSYFRSDHFAFAKAGVPAFSINMGGDVKGRDPEWIEARRKAIGAAYHQPSDEFHEEWDFSGVALIGEYGFLLGRTIAGLEQMPTWKADDPLKAVRDASLSGAASQ